MNALVSSKFMKREFFIHFSFWFSFFVLFSIFRNHITLSYWPFWVGGILGTALPDLDHFIYAFFLKPQELTAQRVGHLLKVRNIKRAVTLLYETRYERKSLVFHTFIFQLIFAVLAFFVLSSSTSIFARGMVLAFLIHLSVDQLADFMDMKNLGNWGNLFPKEMDRKHSIIYMFASVLLIILMGVLM